MTDQRPCPITFTQYLRPHGIPRQVIIDRPAAIAALADRLTAARCRLEIERLRDDTVSMTVEQDDADGDEGTLAHELVLNGPGVPAAVDRLIVQAYAIWSAAHPQQEPTS